jgi:ribosomal protein S6--L-glutamate ligase
VRTVLAEGAKKSDASGPLMHVALVTSSSTPTDEALVAAVPATATAGVLSPAEALATLQAGDVALGRIDVAPTLDGAEPGLDALLELEGRGVRVLNRADPLLTAHDKLLTARAFETAGVPHPRTAWLPTVTARTVLEPPVVVKPRFGSWGRDVIRCLSVAEYRRTLSRLAAERAWFRTDGTLIQELLPVLGFDLRLIVAAGRVVGAIERVAALGEWRTNISLGGSRRPIASVPPEAAALATAATAAVALDLAGVDLLPAGDSWVVLEVNGAAEFTDEYGLGGESPFTAAMAALVPLGRAPAPAP